MLLTNSIVPGSLRLTGVLFRAFEAYGRGSMNMMAARGKSNVKIISGPSESDGPELHLNIRCVVVSQVPPPKGHA